MYHVQYDTGSPFSSYDVETHISTLCFYAVFDDCHFLYSPFAYVDPLHCNMAYLYLELLKDSLNEYAYAAELAGLNYDLQNTVYGMYVSIHSPSPSCCIPNFYIPDLFIILRCGYCGSARPGLTGNFKPSVWAEWKVCTVKRVDNLTLSPPSHFFFKKKREVLAKNLPTQTWLV